MQMSIGLDRLKRFVCLLLIFVLLFCFFLAPRAQAVALEATTIAYGGLLIGTILVGAGVVFSSHGDMVKVGNAMYKTLVNGSNAIGKTISSISAWAVEHGKSLAKGALRVGKDLYQGIIDAFNASYDSDSQTWGGSTVGGSCLINSYDAADTIGNIMKEKKVNEFTISGSSQYGAGRVYLTVKNERELYTYIETSSGVEKLTYFNFIYYSPLTAYYFKGARVSGNEMYFSVQIDYSGGTTSAGGFSLKWPFTISFLGCPVGVSGSDLTYPSDDYLVKMPDIPSVDTETGDVTYPNDTAYTKDAVAVPYPVDTEGVKVPDIPYDVPLDQSTGKALDDTGTDTDNPSKPGEGSGTDTPSDTVNWPSASDLSLPQLIASKFPFCLPFDVIRLVSLLDAEPKAPVFKLPLKYSTVMDEEIVLDVSQWDDVIKVVRWGELIVFVAALIYVTRNYIKW